MGTAVLHRRHAVTLRHSSGAGSRMQGSGFLQSLFRTQDQQRLSLVSINILKKKHPSNFPPQSSFQRQTKMSAAGPAHENIKTPWHFGTVS